ncbi:hypothetical protein G7Z17_g4116 [Cylindrodendrum hubeiense]|uniref:Uncharacterized protein n=1 Tax=Cylindrodendrum hubeiense TaxID=595255 RepID=A0A9P5LA74_9HYPO|nr:hypothetical protein G7Z17_g4116 [Cylindrodendrum hubeiense]
MDEFPWYLKDSPELLMSRLSPNFFTTITWMRHILHSCICVQRVRMYRPFLNPLVGDSWERCVAGSTSALAVYKALRKPNIARFQRSQKMHVQSYQIFSAAVALATFLLVEMPSNADCIRADIEIVLEDLQVHSASVDETRSVPLIADGGRIIERILSLYDARKNYVQKSTTAPEGGLGPTPPIQHDDAPTALVPAIFSVFGGESTAHRYLERCAIEYIVNDTTPGETSTSGSNATVFDLAGFDGAIDSSFWSPWGDALWADLGSVLTLETELWEDK